MNRTAELMFAAHTHAEIVYEQNPDQIVYREQDVINILKAFNIPAPIFDGVIKTKSIEDQIEVQLEEEFKEHFKRIWVQRARYSLLVTVFFYNGKNTGKSAKEIYHGNSEVTKYEDAKDLIIKIINGE